MPNEKKRLVHEISRSGILRTGGRSSRPKLVEFFHSSPFLFNFEIKTLLARASSRPTPRRTVRAAAMPTTRPELSKRSWFHKNPGSFGTFPSQIEVIQRGARPRPSRHRSPQSQAGRDRAEGCCFGQHPLLRARGRERPVTGIIGPGIEDELTKPVGIERFITFLADVGFLLTNTLHGRMFGQLYCSHLTDCICN